MILYQVAIIYHIKYHMNDSVKVPFSLRQQLLCSETLRRWCGYITIHIIRAYVRTWILDARIEHRTSYEADFLCCTSTLLEKKICLQSSLHITTNFSTVRASTDSDTEHHTL